MVLTVRYGWRIRSLGYLRPMLLCTWWRLSSAYRFIIKKLVVHVRSLTPTPPSTSYPADSAHVERPKADVLVANSAEQVKAMLARFGFRWPLLRLIEGFFVDALPASLARCELGDRSISVLRVDGDLYEVRKFMFVAKHWPHSLTNTNPHSPGDG